MPSLTELSTVCLVATFVRLYLLMRNPWYSDAPNGVDHCHMGHCRHNNGLHDKRRFVSAICSLSLSLYWFDKKSHLILNMPQQNLYSNTLMVVLNARRNWSEALYERSLVSDVSSYILSWWVYPRTHRTSLQFNLANLISFRKRTQDDNNK